MEGRACVSCRIESSVIKCAECGENGIETWYCPDCLENASECERCAERQVMTSTHNTSAAFNIFGAVESHTRANLGRDMLSKVYGASDAATTLVSSL